MVYEVKQGEVTQWVYFDGSCPFLTCLETGPHRHPVCPKCGAVKYGNAFCEECRQNVDINRDLAIIEIQAIKAGNSDSD